MELIYIVLGKANARPAGAMCHLQDLQGCHVGPLAWQGALQGIPCCSDSPQAVHPLRPLGRQDTFNLVATNIPAASLVGRVGGSRHPSGKLPQSCAM